MRRLSILLAAVALAGCATNKQLYDGGTRPPAETVSVRSYALRTEIKIGEEWVSITGSNNLQHFPGTVSVLPGTYKVRAHIPMILNFIDAAIVEDSFTGKGGDVVKLTVQRASAADHPEGGAPASGYKLVHEFIPADGK